ncbi:MAG: hypothetical protein KGL95_14225, partial [Patescibacteria group bacterium]|nr:hypothetical protein [Patescibacteria group bacterium]
HLEDQEYKLVAAYDIPDDQERVYMGDIVTTEPSELYPRQDNFRNVEDILWFRSSTSHLVAPQPHILETLPMR